MSVLNPTRQICDAQGRPYFLWDCDMTLPEFIEGLKNPSIDVRAYLAAKLMRQAKPDDVFTFVTLEQIAKLWPDLKRYLGKKLEFWDWLLSMWEKQGRVKR